MENQNDVSQNTMTDEEKKELLKSIHRCGTVEEAKELLIKAGIIIED